LIYGAVAERPADLPQLVRQAPQPEVLVSPVSPS
jgi:hypothetical protein